MTRHVIRRTSVTSAHGKAAPPGVVLVDVAASSWGVLSILEDFTDYIVLQGLGVILSYTRYVAKAYLSTAT